MHLQELGRTGERSVIARQRGHQSVVQRQLRPIAHCKGNFEKRSSEQQNFHQKADLLVLLILLVLHVLPEYRGRAARIRASNNRRNFSLARRRVPELDVKLASSPYGYCARSSVFCSIMNVPE